MSYYEFECLCLVKAKIGVYADTLEDAEEYIKDGQYDDFQSEDDYQVDDIIRWKVG